MYSDNSLKADAYYLDDNGNVISDNLADLSKLVTTNIVVRNAYDFNVNNQVITITQNGVTSDPYLYFKDFITLDSGSYSMYFDVDTLEVQSVSLCDNNTSNIAFSIPYQNYSRFTINNTTTFGFGFEGNGSDGRVFNLKIMIYKENVQLPYQPFGTWYPNNYGENYYKYIVGNNYFANSQATFTQTNNGAFDGSPIVWSGPLEVPNIYFNDNIFNVSSYFNYCYNNAIDIWTQGHVYDSNRYSTSNFTFLSFLPYYNLPTSQTYGATMPLRYFNLTIDASNYNGSVRLTVQSPDNINSSDYEYISVTRSNDDKFNIYYPDSNYFLISVDIQAPYINGSYNFPSSIISNVDYVQAVSDFQLGYDTAKSEYESVINSLIQSNDSLSNEKSTLFNSYRDLLERYNNLANEDNLLGGMVLTIVDAPINIFKSIFDFDILGINLVGVTFGIVTLLIIVWLIKKLL